MSLLPLLLSCTAALAEPPAATPRPDSATPHSGFAFPASAAPAAADTLRYRVVIDAPAALTDTLAASVELIRWQSYADMTGDLLDALALEARAQAQEAAATEGYFSAAVTVDVDRSTNPALVTLHVVAGPQARVASVHIDVNGPAAADAQGIEAIAKLRREWLLQSGAAFRQLTWADAKARAVATLAGDAYAGATLATSEAQVDPQTNTVDLTVTIDSGPLFRVGEIEITGLSRYTPQLVRSYRTFARGDRYSIGALDQYLRRLNGTGYFASVHAAIDTDAAHASAAPLRISVIEAPPKRVEAGLGYSTDTAFRANLSYRDADVDSHATQMYIDSRFESKLQNASLRFVRPPAPDGWSLTRFGKIERTDINGLVTQTANAGARMSSLDERNQWQYGAALYDDRERPAGASSVSSHALYIDVERAWRRVDDLAAPTQGFIALVQAGTGIPGVSTRAFERVTGRFAWWQPVGPLWTISARAEGGAVIGAGRDNVPSALLFRTGGDTTVRGYAFDSLGVQQGNAIVPARYYGAASVEATRWITDVWGIAAFVDAGNAFDRARDFRAAVGYGVGARVRTPIGPFRLDVAYGEQSRQVRLHFSVGLAF